MPLQTSVWAWILGGRTGLPRSILIFSGVVSTISQARPPSPPAAITAKFKHMLRALGA